MSVNIPEDLSYNHLIDTEKQVDVLLRISVQKQYYHRSAFK